MLLEDYKITDIKFEGMYILQLGHKILRFFSIYSHARLPFALILQIVDAELFIYDG